MRTWRDDDELREIHPHDWHGVKKRLSAVEAQRELRVGREAATDATAWAQVP
jgi:hypothetical protein